MYTSFFGLNEKPFSITPDPRYLFMSERHTEALAHLIYGVRESGGFIQLTGEVGTGKTTLVRTLLQQLPENADVAVILHPQVSRNEFLSAICEELHVPLDDRAHNIKDLTNTLNACLLKNHSDGRRTILIVDEAQNLRVDVLEQVRLLTNLETTKQKLLQIILIGQPELREMLSRNELRQVAQRITGRYHLEPLSREETRTYVDHRLKVAGAVGQIFSKPAKRELYRLSHGVPRMINVIADRAMLGAFTEDSHVVTPQLLRKAEREVSGRKSTFGWAWKVGMATIMAALLAGAGWLYANRPGPAPVAKQVPVESGSMQAAPPQSAATTQPVAPESPPVPQPAATSSVANAPTTPDLAADAEPLPETVAGATLEQILADHTDTTTNTDSAFSTLFALWGLNYTYGSARACEQAFGGGLRCLFQRGSLAQVRALDRPAILSLRDAASVQHQIVLAGIDNTHAHLAIGDDSYAVPLGELANFWFGDYLLLWRPQGKEVKQLIPGMRDADIRWLRTSLSAIQGEATLPMNSEHYDEQLEARVRDYQRQRRLTVDGLVGYQTQITINTDLGRDQTPKLARMN